MKVLVVMPSATKHGGAEVALLHLMQQRQCAGVELVVCFLEEGEMVGEARNHGVVVHVLPSGRLRELVSFINAVRKLRQMIAREQPDLVLAWMCKAHLYSGLATLGTPAKAVYFQMGLGWGMVDRLSRWIPAAGALGCSEFVAAEERRIARCPVFAVPLASELCGVVQGTRPLAEVKKSLGLDPDRKLIGMVGRLQRWKGMHVFLEALAIVLRTHPEIRGVIVGGTHDKERDYPDHLAGLLQERALADKVAMVGRQTNVAEWMSAMDIFVHASEREPFGIVVLEAMAMGKPVIATRPGGPEEIIRDQVDGMLVPSNDAKALAAAVTTLIERPQLARELAASGQEKSKQFTTAEFARECGQALRDICAGEPPERQMFS
jgi:glycosyltransferase involved in cell wall biosynthesis